MLKSILFALSALVLSSLALPQTVQAAPIMTQEFLFEDGTSFGVLSVDLDNIDEFGNVLQWEAFELFGFTIGESFLFLAEYNPLNLAAGFTFLNFDVNDISNSFAFQGFWDSAFGEGFMDIFSTDGQFIDAGSFYLSNVTLVSEPATLFLMLGAVGGLLLRRRQG